MGDKVSEISHKSPKRQARSLTQDERFNFRADGSKVETADIDHEDNSDATEHHEQELLLQENNSKKKRPIEKMGYLEKAEKRLKGSRFRLLNEKMYACTGQEALQFFRDEPEAFAEYHEGYREQMMSWPKKPVLQIAEWLRRQ